eukprot:8167800-Prorocentrum_lima.AAC.1
MEPDKEFPLSLSTDTIGSQLIFDMMPEGFRGMHSNDTLGEVVNSLLLLFDGGNAMRMLQDIARRQKWLRA